MANLIKQNISLIKEYKLDLPYFKNGRNAKEQILMHMKDQFTEIVGVIDSFILKSKMKNEDGLIFRDKMFNYLANLLEKEFENKEEMVEFFREIIEELNVKFLFEDATRQKKKKDKTALMLIFTGMVFGHNLDKFDKNRKAVDN